MLGKYNERIFSVNNTAFQSYIKYVIESFYVKRGLLILLKVFLLSHAPDLKYIHYILLQRKFSTSFVTECLAREGKLKG